MNKQKEVAVTDMLARLRAIESRIEAALWEHEVSEGPERALGVYEDARTELQALATPADEAELRELQRVLAYCLLRTTNVLRQLDRHDEAAALADEELALARASGDTVTLGRSLMSHGVTALQSGAIDQGLAELDEARRTLECGTTHDHVQGVGWYWILQADLLNAGIISGGPSKAIEAADRALALLSPIENWKGVARAFAARAVAREALGESEAASKDRAKQLEYDRLAEAEPPTGNGTP